MASREPRGKDEWTARRAVKSRGRILVDSGGAKIQLSERERKRGLTCDGTSDKKVRACVCGSACSEGQSWTNDGMGHSFVTCCQRCAPRFGLKTIFATCIAGKEGGRNRELVLFASRVLRDRESNACPHHVCG